MLSAATDVDAVVVIDCRPGASMITGTPIGVCWPRSAAGFTSENGNQLLELIASAVLTGFERTATQDIGFGLRQLTDVATKALSPGINDPTTAVHALGHSAALLCEMAGRNLGPRVLRDDEGTVRAVLARPGWSDLLDVAVSQPRRYGAADPVVLGRIATLLRELAWIVTREDQRLAVRHQLERLRTTITAQDFDSTEMGDLHARLGQVEHALADRWAPLHGQSAAGL